MGGVVIFLWILPIKDPLSIGPIDKGGKEK
jgi:hypothetical protein